MEKYNCWCKDRKDKESVCFWYKAELSKLQSGSLLRRMVRKRRRQVVELPLAAYGYKVPGHFGGQIQHQGQSSVPGGCFIFSA